MHKRRPILDMRIDITGYIARVMCVHEESRVPPGINIHKTGVDRKALNDWWTGRSIPASRDGIGDALRSIGVAAPPMLIEKCYGLSLSDHYWICPQGAGLTWDDVNFFENDFSRDMGEILFGNEPENPERVSLMSPDNTSDGWLRKKWIISDGKRLLMKGGSGVYRQEPYNEAIAGAIMARLNIPHVPYTVIVDGGMPYCLCENFVTPDTELIPAWRILQSRKQPNNRGLYDHFLDCCGALGMPDIKGALNKMLAVDYIIANEDRHWNNFGCVRDVEKLDWLGFAPVYDSGTSLWYNTQRLGSPVGCKPFRKTHAEQIKYVDDFSWYDIGCLDGLEDDIAAILSQSGDIDERRRDALASAVTDRCRAMEKFTK